MRVSADRTNSKPRGPVPAAEGLRPATAPEMYWLPAILILAATLRLWGLGAKSLWLDEIMTVQKASMSFSDMMGQIRQHDAHPPLFQIVEWLWLRLDKGDAFARAPSVMAGVVCVWLCFLIARRLFGRKAALAAAVMAALSYFGIFYSQEARLHSFMTALFLGQVCLLLAILERRGKAGWGLWLAYGLVGLASLYTYALCALTVGALGVAVSVADVAAASATRAMAGGARGDRVALSALGADAAGAHGGPRSEHSRASRQHRKADRLGGRRRNRRMGHRSAGHGRRGGYLAPAIGLGCSARGGGRGLFAESRRPAKILGVLFFVPLLLYLVLPMPRVHLYEAKHLMFVQPILLIALSGARLPFRALGREWRNSSFSSSCSGSWR